MENQTNKPTNQQIIERNKTYPDATLRKVTGYVTSGQLHLPANYSAANALKAAMLTLDNVSDKKGNPALLVCNPNSIATALLDTVVQGLDPGKKQCYYIVYGNKLVMQRSYFGDMHLAKAKNPDIYDIYADVVYEADEFEYRKKRGRTEIVTHNQKLGNIDKSKIVAAYCTVEYRDGRENTTIMTMDEIRQAWSMSRANPFAENSTHARFPAEMAKKTVTRKACKPLINAADDSTLVLESICRTSDEATDSRLDAEIEQNSSVNDVDVSPAYEGAPMEGAQIIDVDPDTGEVIGGGYGDGQASAADPY